MSVLIQTRGEAGGGVAAHLQCLRCGHFSRSHAHQLSHIATLHPSSLDDVAVGRLGNILMYQSGARLFHCAECFFTSRDFTKLYTHIISKHCTDGRDGGEAGDEGSEKGDGEEDEEEGGKRTPKRKRRSDPEEAEQGKEDEPERKVGRESVDRGQGGEAEGKRTEEEERRTGDELEGSGEVKEEGEGNEDKIQGKRNETEEEMQGNDKRVERDSRAEEMQGGERPLNLTGEAGGGAAVPGEAKPDDGGGKSNPVQVGAHRCLICGWKNRLKALTVNHVVHKHDIPKAFASQAIRRDSADDNPLPAEEEDMPVGLSAEQLKEEMAALAKVLRFTSSRFICLICGWKTKLKGFAISHVMRSHDVERPYSCKDCKRSFFLPSRLQQHVKTTHRPGRYACPFCYFRSHFLGGFRRHCSRCNAREEGDEEEGGARASGGGVVVASGVRGEEEDNEEEGEKQERRTVRKRKKTMKMMEEEEEDDDEV